MLISVSRRDAHVFYNDMRRVLHAHSAMYIQTGDIFKVENISSGIEYLVRKIIVVRYLKGLAQLSLRATNQSSLQASISNKSYRTAYD